MAQNKKVVCNCGPDCTCGCQEGKECTCGGACSTKEEKCNDSECKCGCRDKKSPKKCTCNEKSKK